MKKKGVRRSPNSPGKQREKASFLTGTADIPLNLAFSSKTHELCC